MDSKINKMAWVLPELIEGSGGNRTIIQNIQCLVDHGIECDVYVEDRGQVRGEEELIKLVDKYFGVSGCSFYLGFDIREGYDIVFATAWYLAKVVRNYPYKCKKVYFVQDFEPLFFPMGDNYLRACDSYSYGFHTITIGRWLAHKMIKEYGLSAQWFDFCADTSVYKNLNFDKENAICFIYQPDKPRRCSKIGIEALSIVKRIRPDTKIYVYGSRFKGNIWFDHENLGIISIEECNKLYNRCRVGLCISSSNPSRIPFEMMAAGLPVVDIYMDNNLYDMPDRGVMLAHYTPESIAQALISILDDQKKAREMSLFGQKYMSEKSIESGYDQFYKVVNNILYNKITESVDIEKLYCKDAVLADVKMSTIAENERRIASTYNRKKIIFKLKNNPRIRNNRFFKKIYYILKENLVDRI